MTEYLQALALAGALLAANGYPLDGMQIRPAGSGHSNPRLAFRAMMGDFFEWRAALAEPVDAGEEKPR